MDGLFFHWRLNFLGGKGERRVNSILKHTKLLIYETLEYQRCLGLVVPGARLGRENYGSIPRKPVGRSLKP